MKWGKSKGWIEVETICWNEVETIGWTEVETIGWNEVETIGWSYRLKLYVEMR